MQRRKHSSQTLGFTALLVLTTIQVIGVDSLPSGVSALANVGAGTLLRNRRSPRSVEEHVIINKQPPKQLTIVGKGSPNTNTHDKDEKSYVLRTVVGSALGSSNDQKAALRKAILDIIKKEDAARDQGSATLTHMRKSTRVKSKSVITV
ncbi:uncharacterized protein LOC124623014 [Schistocerca americana]|uniref:uncharacterized protein LOC124623014 n=1 Tax=Schistocerca americana TaxID=7009 RepID=UPI001F5032B0|nr:uncharacterized protein LOC124623014 [Schistocerca americana]